MIKGLMGGQGITVQGGNTSVPYVNQNNSNPMQGMVRIYGSDMQVFDGTAWVTMTTSYATVELNGESQTLLQWTRTERDKQLKREQLVKDNPSLTKAHEAIMRAEANFDILAKFVEDGEPGIVVGYNFNAP